MPSAMSTKRINQELERFFPHYHTKMYKPEAFFDKNGTTLIGFWYYLDAIKRVTVKALPEEQWKDVKEACDDLFCQVSNGKYKICPAGFVGSL